MSTLYKTIRAAARAGGYAVRLFRHNKQIGILSGIPSQAEAIELQARADYLGADEAQLISNHRKTMTLSPQSMRRDR